VYSPDAGSPSGFKSNISLAPDAKSTLDAQMALSKGLAGTASGQLPGIQDFYSRPLDYQSLSEPAYTAITSRLDPEWQSRETSLDTRLTNQGLVPGGEAYENAKRSFNVGRNDAYNQATLASLQNAQQFYNQPLNTFNALRTGAQVQNPQFGTTPQADLLKAAGLQGQYGQGLYNADVGQQNAMTSGLFGLGSAGLMALAISDRRLKSDIVRVGTHTLGIGIYEFTLFGRRERGVMADEVETVRPDAVLEWGGIKMVDYGRL
jgi:hypothetical protein